MLGREDVPILIDQEGGSIYRLNPPIWRLAPAPLEIAKFAYAEIDNALDRTKKLVELNAMLIACEMEELGINVNCAPVADLLIPNAHTITSTCSFGPDPEIVTFLVNSMAIGLKKGGVQPIIKHMLGQGRVSTDSHLGLPIVTENLETLENNDFKVFKNAKNINWGMLAHIKYTSLDPENNITYSQKTVQYIRKKIGFKGILISDCMTMKALSEEMKERAKKAISAGLDLVLYGGSKYEILSELAAGITPMPEDTLKNIQASFIDMNNKSVLNFAEILIEYNQLLYELSNEFKEIKQDDYSPDLKFIIDTLAKRSASDADYSSPVYRA